MFNFFKLPKWRLTMTSAKTKNSTKHTTKKAFENLESSELRSDIENLWIGMERRKFSYTIHIPERRSDQNRAKPE
jgi:hypothetical protein